MYFEFEENGKVCLTKLNFVKSLFTLVFGRKVCKRVPKQNIVFE